ncbi:nuclear transport factor 2 family protein [Stutzerimonas stutzeri]|uniref:nuclear transport factor 2 family protein n=1 Tax=Stutzerimonas stutzeri TaxID=316 RepID=UPI00147E299C|nr:nuclear transport factor 2 family protein [Stutzerimonas stutzeri]WRQ02303.1 nuclear transport factor 2 family protein [Stutzerimonas stutzeri]
MNEQQRIDEILAAEQARREALVADDHTRVSQLFADELVYVHTTGLIHDKAQYLAYARDTVAYLAIERGDLNVRVHGDVAIMTGTQTNTLKKRSEEKTMRAEGFFTQVWARGPAGWQIASFHGSRLPQ